MRILIVNSEYPPIGGGAGNATAHIARRLAKMGHEVSVVTSRFKGLPHKENDEGVTVYRIPALRFQQDRSTAIEQIIFILAASFWTLRLIPNFKPHASLAFFGIPSGAVTWLIQKVYKIPYIVSLRGGDVPGFRPYDFDLYHKLLSPCLRVIWNDSSAIVANSNGLHDLAMKFDSRFEIPIIPNGVDLENIKVTEREWMPPRLLSVGRIVHQKGLDLAMYALAELRNKEWEWVIVGDGPQMHTLKALVQKLEIHEHIIFTGWQNREQLNERYKRSNLFLFPSRHEGMPNAVLEAMASGLPVIASRIAGNEELVVSGETGLLVPTENVEVLRDALRKLLNDAPLRGQMGTASRRRVEVFYSWENTARQYALLLERVK